MFYPGQKVVCVGVYEPSIAYGSFPRKGAVYTVREVLFVGEAPSIRLVEIVNEPTDVYWNVPGPIEAAWIVTAFRPLTDSRIDAILSKAAPTDSERWDNRRKVRTPA